MNHKEPVDLDALATSLGLDKKWKMRPPPPKVQVPRHLIEKWQSLLIAGRATQSATFDCGSFFGRPGSDDQSPAGEIVADIEHLLHEQAAEWMERRGTVPSAECF